MNNTYYVYVHKKRTDGSIFYVGKGTGSRCLVRHGRNTHWNNIVKKYDYSIEIIENNLTLLDALIAERELIEKLKLIGLKLCNQTNGGDGYPGFVVNEETREKFRLAKLGKKQSPDHAKKSATARLGKKNSDWHKERTALAKRRRIIGSNGICFISQRHAAEYLTHELNKKCHQGIISLCARGFRNNAYGVTWSYDTSKTPEFRPTKYQEKIILNIETGIVFKSVQLAKEWVISIRGSANNQCISEAARSDGARMAYGYHWKYI